MPFSIEDNALIRNLYGTPFQRIRLKEDTDVIFEDTVQKGRTGHLTKKIRETRSIDQRHESGRPKHARTEENVTTVNELVSLLSQEDQKQTLRSTRQISRETVLTQSSIVQIIHRDLGLKCLSFTNTLAGYYC